MNLIYTFDKNVYKNDSHKFDIIKSYYINSINSAKRLGYKTEIYTNSDIFNNYVDIINNISNEFTFWDGFKTLPLLDETDGLLVDGDILFHSKMPVFDNDVDLYFDGWESWLELYSECVNELTSLGVKEIIPEWESIPQRVINIGILKINNTELRELYLDRWYKMYKFCNDNKNNMKYFYMCCTITSQYLLTLLSKKYNTQNLSNILGKSNGYYTHFVGQQKYKSNPLSIQKSII
jgi:hypothetical protein